MVSIGSRALWQDTPANRALAARLPAPVQALITLAPEPMLMAQRFDAVIFHGDSDKLLALTGQVASREGAIVTVQGLAPAGQTIALERLYLERSLSVNTAAAGGNASLMTIG